MCRSPSDKRKSDKNTIKAEGQSEIDGVAGMCIPLSITFCQITNCIGTSLMCLDEH